MVVKGIKVNPGKKGHKTNNSIAPSVLKKIKSVWEQEETNPVKIML